ncbi:hypothetical protein ACFLZ6_02410 [Nanoarchaeota archaeon]
MNDLLYLVDVDKTRARAEALKDQVLPEYKTVIVDCLKRNERRVSQKVKGQKSESWQSQAEMWYSEAQQTKNTLTLTAEGIDVEYVQAEGKCTDETRRVLKDYANSLRVYAGIEFGRDTDALERVGKNLAIVREQKALEPAVLQPHVESYERISGLMNALRFGTASYEVQRVDKLVANLKRVSKEPIPDDQVMSKLESTLKTKIATGYVAIKLRALAKQYDPIAGNGVCE